MATYCALIRTDPAHLNLMSSMSGETLSVGRVGTKSNSPLSPNPSFMLKTLSLV